MSAGEDIAATAKPRLPRGVRLSRDEARGGFVLLAPERIVRADPVAAAVLQRCDGARTLSEIVDDLCAAYKGDRGRIETDVRKLLADLFAKKMVEL
jgi:pyrroloquinoline quinone biosynthesis protein D